MIHVYIEKGKEFKVPENGTIDPMFVINCLGKKQYSQAKDDVGGIGEASTGAASSMRSG